MLVGLDLLSYIQRAVVDLNVIEKITKNPALKHYLN